ncbi:TPA: hypothetical protein NU805_000630 [Acinetobacter baumannii]|uniref:hypothetical protein n=1 Tax=Acinetobacter baumannii TaxID=470 RepID=UPI0026E08029|nr:hypothetical protein [Acinetobacter baumannii]MDO5926350.1 hypothetical protein [Acinetobacter baumannii]HCJ6328380.1 hypothetical protein [Acinetobacter baumannii]HCJ6595689.1 hypothetical protein [Acinetobacter baumannii]HCJ6599575.1 hypothetical protein [Acinetobacter baumannii]HCJ6666056.1 hypothetical protein [Acinetobacter baumannii]
MKPYYYLKAYVGDQKPLIHHIETTIEAMEGTKLYQFRGSYELLLRTFAPDVIRKNLDNLDPPSNRELRIALAERLPSYCVNNGLILRQIKTTAKGALISCWFTKSKG